MPDAVVTACVLWCPALCQGLPHLQQPWSGGGKCFSVEQSEDKSRDRWTKVMTDGPRLAVETLAPGVGGRAWGVEERDLSKPYFGFAL